MKNRIMLVLLLMVFMAMVGVMPVFAQNIEMLDEMTLGAKVQSLDCILTSDHVDIGAEIGAKDLSNSDSAKASFYAMGIITIKKWSIFDLSSKK